MKTLINRKHKLQVSALISGIWLILGFAIAAPNQGILKSNKLICTSSNGDIKALKPPIEFSGSTPGEIRISINPKQRKQEMLGIGSSFTESSAFVLAHLSKEKRREVMNAIFSSKKDGAAFTVSRTHIGSCDFSVEGKYCYQDSEKSPFTIKPDSEGFQRNKYPGIKDQSYDLLPMIKEGLAI
ncbi:MAG: hypothetical protein HQL32_18290, partial [Planctomycetes bacterium]|nr:hypothetical protein [Planctomycetota bacterium]